MSTTLLQKELKRIVQKQQDVARDLTRILSLVAEKEEEDLPYGNWELSRSAVKRIERARKEIAAGKDVRLQNAEEVHRYLRAMRHGSS